jgi:uncharacterized membrane protein
MMTALFKDRTGAVAPFVAVLAPLLVASAGFALDAAAYYAANRNLRTATEAAALVAAQDPANATARAQQYLQSNGYPASTLQSVVVGRYCADIGRTAQNRFSADLGACPGNGLSTAVRVVTQSESRQYLTRLLPVDPLPPLSATATAARIDEAGIGVTSGILNVTNTLVTSVNGLLGALTGVQLALTASEIAGLMSGNVDAGLFFDALAQRVGETGTYGQLLERTISLSDILFAAADASDSNSAAVLARLAGVVGDAYDVPLADMFDLGVWQNLRVGEADEPQALRAGLNPYQLLSFAVQAGPGSLDLSNAVSIARPGSTLRIVGLATSNGSRPRFAFGPQGETSAGTSVLRLQLELGIGQISVLGSAVSVDSVPLLIDVAAGQAEVVGIDCAATSEQSRDTRVTVRATSGLVNAYIGEAPANAMARSVPPLVASDIQPARIANVLSLVTVDARAVAQPVFGTTANAVFGPGGQGTIGRPPVSGQPIAIGNTAQTGALLGSLTSSLAAPGGLQVQILGLCLPLVCTSAQQSVRTQLVGGLGNALSTLVGSTADPLLDSLLAALGIQLGQVTVQATGARCGVPVLV